MSPEIIMLMLGAALLHASWNVIVKGGGNPLFETTLNALGGGLGGLVMLPFAGLPAAEAVPFLAGSVALHLLYLICITNAYRHVDLTYGYTIMRGTAPLLTAAVLAALGQNLPVAGWLGVGLLCLGVFTLAADALRKGRFHPKGTAIALCTAVVITGYTLSDGFGTRASLNPAAYIALLFTINALPLTLYTLGRHGQAFRAYCANRGRIGVIGGLCSLCSYGIALWAMTRAPITLVAALRESSVIFGMLLAVVILHERLTPCRVLAVLLVAAGAMAMRLA